MNRSFNAENKKPQAPKRRISEPALPDSEDRKTVKIINFVAIKVGPKGCVD